jgi:predicted NBD/HSP70 family sugar kinase
MYLVINLGGTNTNIASFDDLDSTDFSIIDRFATDQNYDAQLERLLTTIGQMDGPLEGIGFAVGVQLTRDGLGIDKSYTMPGYNGKAIVRDIAEGSGLPVRAANDNVCAVIAETRRGVLQAYERAAYMTVSTGTGAGIRLGQGDTSIAYLAQVGHHIVNHDGPQCSCGQIGCVQAITGGQEFIRRYGKPAAEITDEAVWQEVTALLAVAIVNLARVTRIDAVCVSGGIGYNSPYIRAHLAEMVRGRGPSVEIDVLFPAFGEAAPIVGALMLLRDDLGICILH